MGGPVESKYKLEEHDGIAAIIIHRDKVLLLKRRRLPIILNPGAWSFLYGTRERGERHLSTAFREIKEEVKLDRPKLELLHQRVVMLKDDRKKIKWTNRLFVFRSITDKVKLDFENSKYRWATFKEIIDGSQYTNIFVREKEVLGIIKRYLN